MNDIYNNGSYLVTNPSLHTEDSGFKFEQIQDFLDLIEIDNSQISILDVGGGAGVIGKKICQYYHGKGLSVEFTAIDLSTEMLEIQQKNNPYIGKVINSSICEIESGNYDLVLMIDVIEHIPDYVNTAKNINNIARYVLYNIPIEINFFDILRNIKMKGNYYRMQEKLIGHINRFSYFSCLKFINKNHVRVSNKFIGYYKHILMSEHSNYKKLLESRQRKVEVLISQFIGKKISFLAPLLIQGSNYILARRK